jgi:hypothetical protein
MSAGKGGARCASVSVCGSKLAAHMKCKCRMAMQAVRQDHRVLQPPPAPFAALT